MIDLHLHSSFSADGSLSLDAICQRAIDIGISTIAITDHVDWDWPNHDISFDITDMDIYLSKIAETANRYEGRLRVLKGVEMGLQAHLLDKTRDFIEEHDFDMVIASVHLAGGLDPYDREYFEGKTKEESLRLYYETVLNLIGQYDAFDTLGHLDYVRRYCPYPAQSEDDEMELIDEILTVLAQKNKALEINTSGLRTDLNETLPSPAVCKRFLSLGGRYLTFGSDAHRTEHIGHGWSYVRERLGEELSHFTYYQNRKPCPAGL